MASGLIAPVPRKAGPRPMKIRRPWPAKTVAPLTVEKVTLPSTVTKPPMSRVMSETEISKTVPVGWPKAMSRVRPPTSTDAVDGRAGGVDPDHDAAAGADAAGGRAQGAGEEPGDAGVPPGARTNPPSAPLM